VKELRIYTLANCDTCRRAMHWLEAGGHPFEERPIRESPPTRPELRTMLTAYGGERQRLFNTAGRDYRALKLGARLPTLSDDEALGLLAANGRLVKRPFLLGHGVALVGFDPKIWAAALRRA